MSPLNNTILRIVLLTCNFRRVINKYYQIKKLIKSIKQGNLRNGQDQKFEDKTKICFKFHEITFLFTTVLLYIIKNVKQ